MKIKFHIILLFSLFIGSLFTVSCTLFNNSDEETNNSKTSEKANYGSISSEYWGTWIQMDTGDEYYIDSLSIKKKNSNYYTDYSVVSTNTNGYSFDGENILKKDNKVYFRKGGKTRRFSVKVAGFSNAQARTIAIGENGVPGRRRNKKNSDDTETVISSSDGTLSFTGAVAGDEHEITVADTTSVEINPNYDGEVLGTIPIVEEGTYGFKTTYTIDGDEQGFCYGNYYKTYNLKLNINNIGSKICSTSVYSISYADKNLNIISGNLTGNFSSIEAGKAKEVSLSIRYGKIKEEYVDVPIMISITDSVYNRTWEDSVTVRFYKGVVYLKVNSRNFDENSKANLNAFLIYPDGRAKRFCVSTGSDSVVLVPWSEKDYYLAFSGATAENEMGYSFCFSEKATLADLSGTWTINEINAYETNDSINAAYRVSDLAIPIKAYLKYNDIDFYAINCKNIDLQFKPVSVINYAAKEYDDNIASGKSFYLDIKMKNTSSSIISGVSIELFSSSNYVTVIRGIYNIGDINGIDYYSLTDSSPNESSCHLMESSYNSRAFKFLINEDCPLGIFLPFTVTFTDSYGNSWRDDFYIPINNKQANIELDSRNKYAVCKYKAYKVNNVVNPGEKYYLDIKFTNSGKTVTEGVNIVLSSLSSYVSLLRYQYLIDYIGLDCFYSLSDWGTDRTSCYFMNNGYENSAFIFTVSSSCPSGTQLPFTVTFTDSSGNIWTDTLSIPVN